MMSHSNPLGSTYGLNPEAAPQVIEISTSGFAKDEKSSHNQHNVFSPLPSFHVDTGLPSCHFSMPFLPLIHIQTCFYPQGNKKYDYKLKINDSERSGREGKGQNKVCLSVCCTVSDPILGEVKYYMPEADTDI